MYSSIPLQTFVNLAFAFDSFLSMYILPHLSIIHCSYMSSTPSHFHPTLSCFHTSLLSLSSYRTMEEAMGYNNNNSSSSSNTTSTNTNKSDNDPCADAIIKGKRTKRRRLRIRLPPSSAVPYTPTSSAASVELSGSTTDEEEDLANCLILLARGRVPKPETATELEGKFTSSKFTVAATTTTTGKAGFYVYQCKTCNKCFPSFQALGGHRTSHRKPKVVALVLADQKNPVIGEDGLHPSMNSFSNSAMAPNHNTSTGTCSRNKIKKAHECSICGLGFSSGQALGGHMRRHRPAAAPRVKEERNVFSLDLNLPAQSDDDVGTSRHLCPLKPSAKASSRLFSQLRRL